MRIRESVLFVGTIVGKGKLGVVSLVYLIIADVGEWTFEHTENLVKRYSFYLTWILYDSLNAVPERMCRVLKGTNRNLANADRRLDERH